MELLINAAIISVLGIGFVFLFLSIQVIMTNIVSKIAGKYAYLLPEPVKVSKRPAAKAATGHKTEDGEIVAAITAAIHKFNAK